MPIIIPKINQDNKIPTSPSDLWDYIQKDKSRFNSINDLGKKTYLQYGYDNKFLSDNDITQDAINKTYIEPFKSVQSKPTDNKIIQSDYGPAKINTNERAIQSLITPQGKAVTKEVAQTIGQNRSDNPLAPLFIGFGESASLGLLGKNTQADEQLRDKNPLLYGAGKLAGYTVPFAGATKLTAPLVKGATSKIGSTIGKRLIEGAIAGAPVDIAEGLIAGESAGDIAKRTVRGAAFGAVGDVALYGLGQIGKKLFDNIQVGKLEKIPMDNVVNNVDNSLKIKSEGKFRIKNTQLENAMNKYNDAIEAIQNRFQTNELRSDEIPLIKSELGIDLDALVKNIEDAEKGIDIKAIGEKSKLAQVAGVKPTIELPKNPLSGLNQPSNINALPITEKPVIQALPPLKQQIVSSEKTKTSFGDKLNRFYTKFVDTQKPIVDFSSVAKDKTAKLASNTRNVSGTIDYIMREGLVDKSGKKIGNSLREIVEQIPQNKQNEFWQYMLHKHNVNRAALNKPVYPDYTSDMSTQAVQILEQSNPEFKNISESINNFINSFMSEWGNKSGLISNELWDNLKQTYPNYIPTNRAFSELEKTSTTSLKKGFVNQKAPIKKALGSARNIIDPVESIMNLVNKTVRTARYNEVGKSLLDSLRNGGENLKAFAEVVPSQQTLLSNINKVLDEEGIEGLVDTFNKQYDEVFSKAKGNNIVTVMENGKPVQIQINNKDFLDAMTGLYKSNLDDYKLVRVANNLFKSLITQKNPIFAVRNIARDIPTAYIYGSEKNPIKFAADLILSGKDLVTDNDIAQQYRALGAAGSNFFASNNTAKSAKELTSDGNIIKNLLSKIEYFNNLTESAPRLAEFKRVSKNVGDEYANLVDAFYAASDLTTNFSRGGNTAKKIDVFVPYFNAGVQGLDKLVRSFSDPKQAAQTISKALIGITLPTTALYLLNKDNPNYQQLDNRTKDNYYLIPQENGTFIKIPKSRELGVLFGSLFERLGRSVSGQKESFKGFGNTLATNFSPANPIENNLFSPIQNLKNNKDFADRAIVPQVLQNRSPKYQYDEKTSEIAKWFGEQASKIPGLEDGLSPKQIDYLIKSYTGVIGQLGLPAATKGGSPLKTISTQFIADPLYSNQEINNFYENKQKLETKAADKNFTQNISSKIVTPEERLRNTFNKSSKQISELYKEIRKIEISNEIDKEKKIREIRQKINSIATKTNNLLK